MKLFHSIYIFLLVSLVNSCKIPCKTTDPIPLLIDADTANEIDDIYAIVRAIKGKDFDLRGITASQFHTSPLASAKTADESHRVNYEIITHTQKPQITLRKGSNYPIADINTPQRSEATGFIIEQAHKMNPSEKLRIAILGSCTNVASALLLDPSIVSKIKVYYIGFWHTPETNHYNKNEFNSRNDAIAVNSLLNNKALDLSVMSATTAQHLVFKKEEVDEVLKDKSPIGNYLVDRWERYNRWWTKKDPMKNKWIMWDLALIEAIAHPQWTEKRKFSTPKENTSREISIFTDIDTLKVKRNFWKLFKK